MYEIIEWLSNNLYYSIVIAMVILLIVSFIIGTIKKKEKEKLIEDEIEKEETRPSKKRFVQGQIIKEQDLSINKENRDEE